MYYLRGVLPFFLISVVNIHVGAEGNQSEHDETASRGIIQLSEGERIKAGIGVQEVRAQALKETLLLPGEVIVNAYKSSKVTPRITAQVVERHVRLGEFVKAGQALVTLSSVEMASAQGSLIVAEREWRRVKLLGREIVSERRYTEAQVAQQQALSKVLAYGMSEHQARLLIGSGDVSKATGAFNLIAPQSGTVVQDAFIVGELIEPGRILIDISDESVLWVEARVPSYMLSEIKTGDSVRISLDDTGWFSGTVIQRHHMLDETTRTQGLRIAVKNIDDQLHPGQFVKVEVVTGTRSPNLAVPVSAVTLIAGMPTVFVSSGENEFKSRIIQTGESIGDWVIVQGGLSEGERVVVKEVFFLKSLMLKSSIGEDH